MQLKNIVKLLILSACTEAFAAHVTLNGNWQFFHAPNAQVADSLAATQFQAPDYQTSAFHDITVPSCWAVLGYEEPVYRGYKKQNHEASEGFYRRTFQCPPSMSGQRVLLHFGGVWASAEVWLNGHWLGRHDSGYTSFSFNVTDILQAGTTCWPFVCARSTLAIRPTPTTTGLWAASTATSPWSRCLLSAGLNVCE